MKPEIVTIVGKSNSGKTTLLERVVACLSLKGYKIGSAKHTHCGFDIDKKGKDSWRHRKSGTHATLMVTDDQAIMIKDDHRSPVEKMADYLHDTDLIIAEGFKSQDLPKIEVYRKQSSHKIPLFMETDSNGSQTTIAFVTDSDFPADVPTFGLDDIEIIADFIECHFLKKIPS